MTFQTFAPATSATSNHSRLLYDIKESLKTAWGSGCIKSSGDGSTQYSSSGDVITTRTPGTNGPNDRWWFVAEDPDGKQHCVQGVAGQGTGSATAISWRVKVSPSAKFTGGSPSANTVPSATDEGLYCGTGTDASPVGANFLSGQANNVNARYSVFGRVETTSPYRFVFAIVFDQTSQTGRPHGGWLCDQVEAPNGVTIPHPFVYYCGGKSTSQTEAFGGEINSTTYNGFGTSGQGGAGAYFGSVSTANFKEAKASAYANQTNANTSPFSSGAEDLLPLVWLRANNQADPDGFFGISSMLRFVMQGLGSPDNDAYNILNGQNIAREWLRLMQCAIYWGGAANPYSQLGIQTRNGILWLDEASYEIGNTAGYDAGYDDGYDVGYDEGETAGLIAGYDTGYADGYDEGFTAGVASVEPPDEVLPTIQNFVPASGSEIKKTESIGFDIVDPNLRAIVIFAIFPSTGAVELIYDSEQFRTRYTSSSVSVVDAETQRFRITRNGGWYDRPRINYVVVDSGGNLGVIA